MTEGQPHEAITIWEVNKDRLDQMNRKISYSPKLLTRAAGKSTCSIFRVPQSFVDINGKSYQPQIVSIGPYHRGEPHLKMIEEHKWAYLGSMLSRVNVKLEDLLMAVHPLEAKARECYSQAIDGLDTEEFLEMMVLDGCFILELFRKIADLVRFEEDDPIVTMAWIMSFFRRDLLRLENQVPYFILEALFEATRSDVGGESGVTLTYLALNFFNYATQRPDYIISRQASLEARHLLDLVRTSYIQEYNRSRALLEPNNVSKPTHIILCISKLRRAGIKLRQGNADSFLVVKFRDGVIEMSPIIIDDFMTSFLLNCVAYEQCHNSTSKHFTTYATLLDCLAKTAREVEYLCDQNIVENYLGTEAEVARFLNNLGKEVTFDIDICYLAKLFSDVDRYYVNSWRVQWAYFEYTYFTYFREPWSFISALAAATLLILTVIQTLYTVFAYYSS